VRPSRRKVCDTKEIARRFKFGDEHVRRILRIGYLAPDIIEAIIEGRQPRFMMVKRLLQRVPCDWADQRAAFDFLRLCTPRSDNRDEPSAPAGPPRACNARRAFSSQTGHHPIPC
jgi:hypothetical protein